MKTLAIAAKLDRLYPGLKWRAVRDGFGWEYHASNGWIAYYCSALAPRFDGDDETCRSELWIYKDSTQQKPERVFFFPPGERP